MSETLDALLDMSVPGGPSVAPGGERIAYQVARASKGKDEESPESRIWMVEIDRGESWQVTFGPGNDRHPCWSPRGDRLAYLSDREKRGKLQLYVLHDSPGEALKLTELPASVSNPQWAPDGKHLALLSTDHAEESDNDVKLFDADRRFQRLYLVDADTGECSAIDHGDLQIWEYCWSPDGSSFAAIVSDESALWAWYHARLVRIDVSSGSVTTLCEPERQVARPAWSPDGNQIAMITSFWSDPEMTGGDVLLVNVANGSTRQLGSGQTRSHLTCHWLPDGSGLLTMAWERARAHVSLLDLDGNCRPLWTEDLAVDEYGASFDPVSGTVASVISGPNQPSEIWAGTLTGDDDTLTLRPVTSSNEQASFPNITSGWLTWESSDGLQIEGLYLAPTEGAGSSAPAMVTFVRGGPTAATSPQFPSRGPLAWIPILLQHGVAVFMPNYRGSNGYGLEFAETNMGDLGGMDLQDILTGVDACVARGLADPDRLGIGGWSYGGYLTAWAITQTTRFRAAVAGASITNWYSFHGGTDRPGFDSQFIGAPPDELDGPYAWRSPLFRSKSVRTPTLFIHGELDECCPVGQAYEMTRALRRHGVPVECAVYPPEGHRFAEREHLRDMTNRATGWFATYLDNS